MYLLECDYSTVGLWADIDIKQYIGKNLSELHHLISPDYAAVPEKMLEILKLALHENRADYKVCEIRTPSSDHQIIVMLVTTDEQKLQLNCIQLQDWANERQVKTTYENALNSIQLLTSYGKSMIFSYVMNEGTVDIFGADGHSLLLTSKSNYRQYIENIHPDDRKDYLSNLDALYSGKIDKFTMECRIMFKHDAGVYHYYKVFVCMAKNDKNQWMIVGLARDIHEEKMAVMRHKDLLGINLQMYNKMPVGVEIYDKDACLISVNDKDLEHFGLTNETIPIGSCLYDHPFLTDEQKEMLRQRKAFTMVLAYDFEKIKQAHFYETKNRGTRYFDVSFTPLFHEDGTFHGFMNVNMDMTEMHRNHLQLQEMSSNLELAMTAGNISAWIYYPNKQIFKTLKGEPLANNGKTLEEIQKTLHPDDVKKLIEVLDLLMSQKQKRAYLICRFLHPDGTYHSYESYMQGEVVLGKVISISGTLRDVTDNLKAKEELMKAKEKAEQSDKLKSAFLANMSHEIRTPLNAIVGFSDALKYATSDKEREQYYQIIEQNTGMLLELINKILDLSKIESGTITIKKECFDANAVVLDAVNIARLELQNKPITMKTELACTECFIEFDKFRFTQILNNYLSNAVKYTQEGTIKTILECRKDGVKIQVTDTGNGIEEKNFKRVFSRFNKFDEFAHGTGLGLSICKAITDAVGGEVGFESKLDEGSTFWAWIPCKVYHKSDLILVE